MKPRNDRALALSAFCLEIEKHRRTPEGRVRNAEAFLQFYFPRHGDGSAATDRLFLHLPPEVRGPILAGWRVRGLKAALRDDDERVKAVVLDALEAGDVDSAMFEDGVTPDTLVDFAPLDEWWAFWRGAALPNAAVQRALATARAMHLIDDTWFLETVSGRAGKLKGTDAICDTLTKDEITSWVRGVHASGDASPAGMVAARGWDAMLAKTAPDALLGVLDAFARKVHLVAESAGAPALAGQSAGAPALAGPSVPAAAAAVLAPAAPTPPRPVSQPPRPASRPPPAPRGYDANAPLDLSAVDTDAAPTGGWPDDEPIPVSVAGESVRDEELLTIETPHRPPPLPK